MHQKKKKKVIKRDEELEGIFWFIFVQNQSETGLWAGGEHAIGSAGQPFRSAPAAASSAGSSRQE